MNHRNRSAILKIEVLTPPQNPLTVRRTVPKSKRFEPSSGG